MVTKMKKSVALILLTLTGLGFPDTTNALCNIKDEGIAVCHKLHDVQFIDTQNLTALIAPVRETILTADSLKTLSKLKTLDLSNGELEIIEPGAFDKMTHLQHLKLSDNSIAEFTESSLTGLKTLKSIDLRRNKIRQIPPALSTLKNLKNLEIAGNPLECNCATLRARDEILENAVKISKKVVCSAPSHLKGVSLLKSGADVICMFEEQDDEMQADEASGSGDSPDDTLIDSDIENLTKEPLDKELPVPASRMLLEPEEEPKEVTDDLIFAELGNTTNTEAGENNENAKNSSVDNPDKTGTALDFDFVESGAVDGHSDDLIVEGSGLTAADEDEDLGSGAGEEGSGTDDIWQPVEHIHFGRSGNVVDEQLEFSSTTEQTSTTPMSWFDILWSTFSGDPSSTTPRDDSDTEGNLTDEEFINVGNDRTPDSENNSEVTDDPDETSTVEPPVENKGGSSKVGFFDLLGLGIEETVVTDKAVTQGAGVIPPTGNDVTEKSGKLLGEDFSDLSNGEDATIDDRGEASTRQTKKSMGSYVVLAALLGVLGALVGFAAYKGNFCRSKPDSDVERGTELKDMQKSLLEGNGANQPKIASNGNAESAPLVAATQPSWGEPREVKPWEEQNTPTVDSGVNHSPAPPAESEPVKPPRRSLPPQEEQNGLPEVKTHSPMSSFAPKPQEVSTTSIPPPGVVENGNHSPPLSPNTQRVKITLQENPDSVPKTPILITRTKAGENLVKRP
ncbi:protein windpipe isoform X1 [Athalia rosae]|uniref:protein windpipe isoform X1 n=2 Tax=Athalia rosae TaxID=37344 RepID=UPI0020345DFD|nr:protein windpipe isoform X1 [Athalia rosae]